MTLGRVICGGALISLAITPLIMGLPLTIWLGQMYFFFCVAGPYIAFCWLLLCVGDYYNTIKVGRLTSRQKDIIRLQCENYDLSQEVKSLKRMIDRLVRWEKQHEQTMEV